MAGAETVGVYMSLAGEHTSYKLFLRHFEREQSDNGFGMKRGILSERQAKRGLAHRGAAGDDYQICPLQAGGHVVELAETGREARDAGSLTCGAFLNASEDAFGDRLDTRETLLRPCFGDLEYLLLGAVEYDLGIVLFGQSLARDRVASADQIAN